MSGWLLVLKELQRAEDAAAEESKRVYLRERFGPGQAVHFYCFTVCMALLLFTSSSLHLLRFWGAILRFGPNSPKYESTRKAETALSFFLFFSIVIFARALRLNTRHNKKHEPAEGFCQLSAMSVHPAIDYSSAGGHKWPVIIWRRNIYPRDLTCR